MSIIHDALRKVQSSFQRKPAGDAPLPEKERKKFSPFSLFLVLLLLCSCLYFGYNQLIKHWDNIRMAFDLPNIKFKKIEIPKITITTSDTTAKKPRVLAETHPPVAMAKIETSNPQVSLNVQGILTQGGQTVALINDKIYEEGDVIGNIRIQNIEGTGITILREGKSEHISVRP